MSSYHFVLILLLLGRVFLTEPKLQEVAPNELCKLIQTTFENLLFSKDKCVLLSMDTLECPLRLPNIAQFSVSRDQLFTGIGLRMQKISLCERVVAFFENFNPFWYLTHNKDLNFAFQPYSQITVMSMTSDGFEDKEGLRRAVLNNGLFMDLGRILNNSHHQTKDILTREMITHTAEFKVFHDTYVNTWRSYKTHPIFTMEEKEFNVSLFHCPPHVIKLDDRQVLDR